MIPSLLTHHICAASSLVSHQREKLRPLCPTEGFRPFFSMHTHTPLPPEENYRNRRSIASNAVPGVWTRSLSVGPAYQHPCNHWPRPLAVIQRLRPFGLQEHTSSPGRKGIEDSRLSLARALITQGIPSQVFRRRTRRNRRHPRELVRRGFFWRRTLRRPIASSIRPDPDKSVQVWNMPPDEFSLVH